MTTTDIEEDNALELRPRNFSSFTLDSDDDSSITSMLGTNETIEEIDTSVKLSTQSSVPLMPKPVGARNFRNILPPYRWESFLEPCACSAGTIAFDNHDIADMNCSTLNDEYPEYAEIVTRFSKSKEIMQALSKTRSLQRARSQSLLSKPTAELISNDTGDDSGLDQVMEKSSVVADKVFSLKKMRNVKAAYASSDSRDAPTDEERGFGAHGDGDTEARENIGQSDSSADIVGQNQVFPVLEETAFFSTNPTQPKAISDKPRESICQPTSPTNNQNFKTEAVDLVPCIKDAQCEQSNRIHTPAPSDKENDIMSGAKEVLRDVETETDIQNGDITRLRNLLKLILEVDNQKEKDKIVQIRKRVSNNPLLKSELNRVYMLLDEKLGKNNALSDFIDGDDDSSVNGSTFSDSIQDDHDAPTQQNETEKAESLSFLKPLKALFGFNNSTRKSTRSPLGFSFSYSTDNEKKSHCDQDILDYIAAEMGAAPSSSSDDDEYTDSSTDDQRKYHDDSSNSFRTESSDDDADDEYTDTDDASEKANLLGLVVEGR